MPRRQAAGRDQPRNAGGRRKGVVRAGGRQRSGTVRIIGGYWRGRKLRVPDGVRPTPDRVRETLGNWLSDRWRGARVLDLFAGSGALAFEALSRGASQALLVERDFEVAQLLREQCERLRAPAAVQCAEAPKCLAQRSKWERWDVVFLDPPFGSELLNKALAKVAPRLAAYGVVYVETDAPLEELDAEAAGLALVRSAQAGSVYYGLLEER